ncbi:MAG: hypothetical protein WCB97_07735 [Thiobacillus sp.]
MADIANKYHPFKKDNYPHITTSLATPARDIISALTLLDFLGGIPYAPRAPGIADAAQSLDRSS